MTELPKGHVKEACKEWLVREDSALAQRLQSQEINEFYQNNKVRNAIVREDFPKALDEQRKEVEVAKEVEAQYRQYLENQEKNDRLLAEKLENNLKIEKLRNEEIESNQTREFALRLQRREEDADRERMLEMQAEVEKAEQLAKRLQKYEEQHNTTQAERDRLLAIKAQNEELAEKDRQLAIQAQDEELAKMLQDRERKRAKRLREKYRLKKQQQKQQLNITNNEHTTTTSASSSANDYNVDETYSDPIDLIAFQPNGEVNHDNKLATSANVGVIPKQRYMKSIPIPPTSDSDENDSTYALPINVHHKKELNALKDFKPKLPKPNSLHELPNHIGNKYSEFGQVSDISPTSLSKVNYSNNYSTSATTPTSGDEYSLHSMSTNSYNKKKKDKKDKCSHQ